MNPSRLFYGLAFAAAPSLLRSLVTASTCFYPSGAEASQDFVCNPLAKTSFCCGLGYACLGNKLCVRTAEATDNNPALFNRGSCTDQTFESPDCPQFCNEAGGESQISPCSRISLTRSLANRNGGSGLFNCSQPSLYCCAGLGCDCDIGNGLSTILGSTSTTTVIPNPSAVTSVTYSPFTSTTTRRISTNTPSVSTSTSSLGKTSSSSISLPTLPTSTGSTSSCPTRVSHHHETTKGSGSSTALKAGLGVGVPVGIIATTVAVIFMWRRSRRQPRSQDALIQPTESRRDAGVGRIEAQSPILTFSPLSPLTPPIPGETRAPNPHAPVELSDLTIDDRGRY